MTWFLSLILASSVFTASPLTAIVDFSPNTNRLTPVAAFQEETEITENIFPLNPDGRIEVSNINGSIEIEGWDRPEVKLISKKVASTRERLGDVEVKTTSSPEHLKIEVDYKRWQGKWIKGDNLNVNFNLMVPRTAILKEIGSVNGSISVSGVNNVTTVSAVNGSVRASDLKGSVEASTVNGSVIAVFKEVTPNSEISLSTVNGSAEIRLPSNVDATVKADSVNGSIANGFGLPVRKGEYTGRDLYGRIGSGASKIRMNSVNGSLKISRIDDGLPLNAVENLLPSKTSDDFDDSFSGKLAVPDVSVVVPDVKAKRAAKESMKAAKEIETETIRSAAAIAAETARLRVEAIAPELSSLDLARLNERTAAELARARLDVFGNRSAPLIVEDSRTVHIDGIPNVEVKAEDANVVVKAWNRNEIKYTVTRLTRGRQSPVENISFTEDRKGFLLEVKLVSGAVSGELLEQVNVELYLPRNANLTVKTNREIRVQGIVGELKLVGRAEPINVRDSGGFLDVSSRRALIRVIGFDGKVDAKGHDGDIYLEGNFEAITSTLESGEVFLTVGEDAGATIHANTIGANGEIAAYGKTLNAVGLSLQNKADGTWKLGGGESQFRFSFTTGRLNLRSLKTVTK